MKTWKKVIRVIAHELNNSLAPISSLAHSGRQIAASRDPAKLERIFEIMEDRIRHLHGFIDGYASFAKLPQPRLKPVDWPLFIEALQHTAPFVLTGSLPQDPGVFDPAQLEQVLINLIRNAREAGTGEAQVEIEIQETAGGMQVRVLDRGAGMTDEAMRSAFSGRPELPAEAVDGSRPAHIVPLVGQRLICSSIAARRVAIRIEKCPYRGYYHGMPRKAPRIDDVNLIEQLLQELQRGSMSWADSCRFLRASQGMTQGEFAAKVGVAVKIIKELENESGNPTLASLNRIAASIGMKVGFVKPSSRTVTIGTEEIVRERKDERLASLRDLKQGKTTLKKLHAENAIRGSDFKLGLPKLS